MRHPMYENFMQHILHVLQYLELLDFSLNLITHMPCQELVWKNIFYYFKYCALKLL